MRTTTSEADLSRSQILRNTAPQHPPKPVIARAAPVIFHGRQEYVSTIVQTILRSQQPHAAILGAGGMGKTSVALAVVNDRAIIARFRTRRHFVPCEEITRTTLLIEHIANHLGIALSPLNQLQDIITSLRETLSPCIVVLDNFETTWGPHETRSQVEDIIAQLACVPGLVLIVTMRGTLTPLGVSWSQTLPQISRLSPDAARVTFLDICPRQDDMLDTLLQSLDFVPLAITLIAKVGEASQLSPSALLKKWKKEQTKLLNLGPSDRLQSVDHSIALSLQSASMTANPEALQLLSVLAMLPSGALLERLPRLAPRIVHIDAAVWSLLRTSLVYQDETGGPLQLLSPIRSYISQHHAPDIDSLQDLREYYYRIASKCLCKPGDAGFINIKKEVIPEGHNMEAVLSDALTRCGDEDSVIASLQYSRFLYWNSPRTDNLKLALQVIRTAPYPRLLGRCLLELGDMHRLLNQYERARSTLEEAQRHFAQTGKQIEVAHCLWILSDILNMQCRYDEAIAMLADAQQRFQTLNNGLGVAQCLRSLGNALRMKNLYEEARIVLEDARQRCEEADYPVGCAQCMWSIGNVLRKQSRYAEARFMLEEAQRQFRELGNRLGMAQCMRTLGNILRNQRHYDEARPLLEDARRELVDIGDRLGAAQILRNLGDILRMECYHNEARIVLEHAMRQFKGLGYRVGAAQTLRSLGNILRVQRRLQEARLVFNEARQEFQVLGYRSGAAQCLWGLGEILRVEGSYEEAHVVLVDSLTQLRDIGDPTGVAWCLKSIGDTFFDEGRYDEAWPALENAKDWFKDVDPYGITECQETIDKILLARGGDDVDGYLLLDQGEDPPVGAEDRLPG
jgi:tetratricopeptide (TPR) repeat protein